MRVNTNSRRLGVLAACAALLLAIPGRANPTSPAHSPAWLEQAVFYQVYPQSFSDSNGDGIGDLQGVIDKLPYLHALGITAIWLNPCFESPFRDAGYDISDYTRVAPRYGTNADLRRLFATAHGLGIKVILDLVVGHTSDQHAWFVKSSQPEPNAYSDWYIWTRSVWEQPNESSPPVVVGTTQRDGNYLVNFFSFQPALNFGYAKPDPKQPWQQPVDAPGPRAVRAEVKRLMQFWFDQGVDGFRVDMAGSLVKNDPDGSATAALWQEFRGWMDTAYPDRVMVSEWSNPKVAIPAGFHMDFLLPWALPGYGNLFRPDNGRAPIFGRAGTTSFKVFFDEFQPLYDATRGQGFIAIPTGNHDMSPRLGNGRDPADLAVAYAFLLTMPGVPFLYYGDELGMRSPAHLPSKEGGFDRTPVRTPMQWSREGNAGFSAASPAALYLPVAPDAERLNVAAEQGDADSPLETVRRLVALRRSHAALGASGAFAVLAATEGQPLVLERSQADEHILVAINPTDKPQAVRVRLPGGWREARLLAGASGVFARDGDGWRVSVPAVSYSIVELGR